ncbi:hypothetical protein SAMN05216387_103290 [Nitrosovibrio tenuis]|uniref:Uncharacterized protein n=1 Tax=Nitrosovibrio tenuis TaxID=1233 RepID=A0A1H7KNP1_9PROT|nr:hypothetical protein SAMN05216387_103290 [Nitrosovibrio tenuis]
MTRLERVLLPERLLFLPHPASAEERDLIQVLILCLTHSFHGRIVVARLPLTLFPANHSISFSAGITDRRSFSLKRIISSFICPDGSGQGCMLAQATCPLD